jgi:hypothetical protein
MVFGFMGKVLLSLRETQRLWLDIEERGKGERPWERKVLSF